MGEPGCFFEVADGEFARRVGSVMAVCVDGGLSPSFVDLGALFAVVFAGVGLVVTVGFGGRQCQVGDERVMAPVGPQLGLVTCEAGAAHHETNLEFVRPFLWIDHLVLCFGYLCFAAPGDSRYWSRLPLRCGRYGL